MSFSLTLKQLRTSSDMTQEDLAEALDVSPVTVRLWERGASTPRLDMAVKIADLFNVTLDALVKNGEAPPA